MKLSVNVSDKLIVFIFAIASMLGLYVYAPENAYCIIPVILQALQLYEMR